MTAGGLAILEISSRRRLQRFVVLIAAVLSAVVLAVPGVAVTLGAQQPPAPVAPLAPPALPALEKQVVPVYPSNAMAAGVQGVVRTEASISPEGRVAEARVVQSIALLDNAALDAVRQWQFAPGAGVRVVPVTVEFRLIEAPIYDVGQRSTSAVPAWMPQ